MPTVPLLILLHSLGIICVRKALMACNDSIAARRGAYELTKMLLCLTVCLRKATKMVLNNRTPD